MIAVWIFLGVFGYLLTGGLVAYASKSLVYKRAKSYWSGDSQYNLKQRYGYVRTFLGCLVFLWPILLPTAIPWLWAMSLSSKSDPEIAQRAKIQSRVNAIYDQQMEQYREDMETYRLELRANMAGAVKPKKPDLLQIRKDYDL